MDGCLRAELAASPTLPAAAEEQRRRVPTYRGLNHRPESAPAGGGEAAAHRLAPPHRPPGRRALPPRLGAGAGAGRPGESPAPPLWCNGWVWLPACLTFLGVANPPPLFFFPLGSFLSTNGTFAPRLEAPFKGVASGTTLAPGSSLSSSPSN